MSEGAQLQVELDGDAPRLCQLILTLEVGRNYPQLHALYNWEYPSEGAQPRGESDGDAPRLCQQMLHWKLAGTTRSSIITLMPNEAVQRAGLRLIWQPEYQVKGFEGR